MKRKRRCANERKRERSTTENMRGKKNEEQAKREVKERRRESERKMKGDIRVRMRDKDDDALRVQTWEGEVGIEGVGRVWERKGEGT